MSSEISKKFGDYIVKEMKNPPWGCSPNRELGSKPDTRISLIKIRMDSPILQKNPDRIFSSQISSELSVPELRFFIRNAIYVTKCGLPVANEYTE